MGSLLVLSMFTAFGYGCFYCLKNGLLLGFQQFIEFSPEQATYSILYLIGAYLCFYVGACLILFVKR